MVVCYYVIINYYFLNQTILNTIATMVSYKSNNMFELPGLSSLFLVVFGLLSATLVSAQNHPYVIGTYGSATCSAGDPILDEDECRDAVAPALSHDGVSYATGQFCTLQGCIATTDNVGNIIVNFNANLDPTTSSSDVAPICKIPVSTAGG